MAKNKSDMKAVLWWIGWITLTIATFFIASWFWTGIIARHYGPMDRPWAPALWVSAVFGSWMVLLVPLIILMYNKVDKAYEDARISRETVAFQKAKESFRVRSVLVEEPLRLLPKALSEKLKKIPSAVKKGHLVTAILKDGRRIDNVFVMGRRDVLGVYDQETLPFRVEDIADLEPADLDRLPAFRSDKWLRLDGVGAAGPV